MRKDNEEVTSKSVIRDLAKLTLPIGILNFLSTATSIVEVGFMSYGGPAVLQASYVVDVNLNFAAALGQLSIQAQPYISEQYGLMLRNNEEDRDAQRKEISIIAKQSWLLAGAVGIPGTVFLLVAKPIALGFGYNSEVADVVGSICVPLAFGIPFQSMVLVDQIIVTSTGHEKIVIALAALDTFIGVFFNYVLLAGNLGFPSLGPMSIGVVGASRMFINWALYKLYFAFNKDYKKYEFFSRNLTGSKPYAKEILKEGLPLFLIAAAVAGTRIPITSWVEQLGGDRAEVMQISAVWSNLFGIIPVSAMTATGILISRMAKMGDKALVRKYGSIGLTAVMLTLAVPSLLYPIIPRQLCAPLVNAHSFTPAIQDNLHWIFLGLLFNNLFQSYGNALTTNLENVHKTLYPGIISVAIVLLALPFSYLAGNVFGTDLLGMNAVDGIAYALISLLLLSQWQGETRDQTLFQRIGITNLMGRCGALCFRSGAETGDTLQLEQAPPDEDTKLIQNNQ